MKGLIFYIAFCSLILLTSCRTPCAEREKEPETFTTPGNTSQTAPSPPPMVISDNTTIFTGLKADIIFQLDQWIPNTMDRANKDEYEKLRFSSIIITASAEDNIYRLADNTADIIILPPEDFAFDPDEISAKGSNVYTNQGTGLAFYGEIEDTFVELVRFIRKTEQTSGITSTNYYTPVYNPLFFEEKGTAKAGFRLFARKSEGALTFSGTINGKPFKTTTFAVAAIGKNVRPGDDFLLRFGLANTPSIEGTVKKGDFTAVYDKKMLWRANLYIDESLSPFDGAPTTTRDWNDLHPWNTEDNEWNRTPPDYTGVPGGQVISIYPWTRFIDGEDAADDDKENNEEIYNTVAYSLGGIDTPFDFNIDLEKQISALQAYYKEQNHQWQNWNLTTAPENDWDNYLGGIPDDENVTHSHRTINNKDYYPYRPGYASFHKKFFWVDVNYSAGIDCNGYVDLATNYKGNRYTINENEYYKVGFRERWSTYILDNTKHFVQQFKTFSWHIWDDKPRRIIKDNEIIPANMVVPGDMIVIHYYWVHPKTGYYRWDFDHVAIVGGVEYIDDQRNMTRDSIILLEAAAGNDEYKVMNYRRLGGLRRFSGFNHWTFTICRLKEKD